jgi:hypothetical protein
MEMALGFKAKPDGALENIDKGIRDEDPNPVTYKKQDRKV